MKIAISLCLFCFCSHALCGSLYTFNKSDVQLNALNWIQSLDSELAKSELQADRVTTKLDKSRSLVASVYFTYKTDDEYGFRYVCAKVNENGELLGFDRDIKVYKGKFNDYQPDSWFCKKPVTKPGKGRSRRRALSGDVRKTNIRR